eukprot:TRINITY_DN28957_c0_g1_i1.p1 TRINITY_DN28957_c0_g1~~TRINITY_DN28957_c0_g1_i1.p1  ORF type:complete len:563 (-),score=93.29 TRINITY_DN28957_c0_g1_i1:84-1772(-)
MHDARDTIPESVLFEIEYPPRVAELIARVLQAARSIQDVKVHAFGSSVNGFGDAQSDVDLVLEATTEELVKGLNLHEVFRKADPREVAPTALQALIQPLRQTGFAIKEQVLTAKVPILKLHFGVDCDLSCNNLLPFFNTRLLKVYSTLDPRVVGLVQELKRWAKLKGVHGADKGNLSSYSFTLLAIFYMQQRAALPCLQKHAEEKPSWYYEGQRSWNVAMSLDADDAKKPAVDRPGLATLRDFAGFLTQELQWGKDVVSVRKGQRLKLESFPRLSRKSRNTEAELLHIEDPFDIERNLNCVLAPGHNEKLWWALTEVASGHYPVGYRSPGPLPPHLQIPSSPPFAQQISPTSWSSSSPPSPNAPSPSLTLQSAQFSKHLLPASISQTTTSQPPPPPTYIPFKQTSPEEQSTAISSNLPRSAHGNQGGGSGCRGALSRPARDAPSESSSVTPIMLGSPLPARSSRAQRSTVLAWLEQGLALLESKQGARVEELEVPPPPSQGAKGRQARPDWPPHQMATSRNGAVASRPALYEEPQLSGRVWREGQPVRWTRTTRNTPDEQAR